MKMMMESTPAKIGRLMKKSEKFMSGAGSERTKQWPRPRGSGRFLDDLGGND
jgi:hypothetical protein